MNVNIVINFANKKPPTLFVHGFLLFGHLI